MSSFCDCRDSSVALAHSKAHYIKGHWALNGIDDLIKCIRSAMQLYESMANFVCIGKPNTGR